MGMMGFESLQQVGSRAISMVVVMVVVVVYTNSFD
jgi:hypothetical protein